MCVVSEVELYNGGIKMRLFCVSIRLHPTALSCRLHRSFVCAVLDSSHPQGSFHIITEEALFHSVVLETHTKGWGGGPLHQVN